MTSHTDIFHYTEPTGAIKRGRRLITIEAGITSELGGLPREVVSSSAAATATSSGTNAVTTTMLSPTNWSGGVRMFPQSGAMSVATFRNTGRRRTNEKPFSDTDPTRSDRGDYVVAAWEGACKRHLEPARHDEKPQGLHHTPRRESDCAPFATSSDLNPIPFHRQRRYVAVPGANSADADQTYVPKRSRTPPASAKLYCEKEGFTVIHSTNAAEKQKLVAGGVRMIPFDKHGKGTHTTAEKVAAQRQQEEEKREANFRAHRQYLREVAQRIVDGRREEVHGKRIGVYHPPERPGGPNAVNLPTNPKHVVGCSAARGRTPAPVSARAGWVR